MGARNSKSDKPDKFDRHQHREPKDRNSGMINTVEQNVEHNHNVNERLNYNRLVKSPSDTTIYSPGLRKANNEDISLIDQLLLQAEKFKAKIEAPKGNNNISNFHNMIMPYDYDQLRSKFVKPEGLAPLDSELLFLRNFDQDDEFFHITSQIDPSLRSKIERGEYIELERLLPKDRTGRSSCNDLNKQLFQLITQGTNSYMEHPFSVKPGVKTNSIKKWDQAFRVFAAIYTNANPARASEIWQYVYVIHTAAASNPWENVYYYDINFRELMASKPWRSWAKTYTQGWNMAFNNYNATTVPGQISHSVGHSNNFNNKSHNNHNKSWKDDCCWRYNKNRCKKPGSDCNYDHRCTFCAGWNHGFHNCRKRLAKQKRNSSGNMGNSSPKAEK